MKVSKYKEREKNSYLGLAFTLELQNTGLHPREPNHLGHVGSMVTSQEEYPENLAKTSTKIGKLAHIAC